MANRYISLKVVIDNILDHPMLKDVSFERAVNYTVNFLRIVGCPDIFNERVDKVEIKDYRGLIPCEFDNIIQVRVCGECHNGEVLRHTTDSFHMSENYDNSYDLTYKVQGNIIYTTLKEGVIEIAYRAIAVDEDGYPLIPDNSSFITALEFYIKKKHFTILFDQEKIKPVVYNQVCQDYAFAVGQAQSDLIRPTIDQMESITNSINTLVPRVTEHSKGFINNGVQEKLRNH